jgi:hypothetical protein
MGLLVSDPTTLQTITLLLYLTQTAITLRPYSIPEILGVDNAKRHAQNKIEINPYLSFLPIIKCPIYTFDSIKNFQLKNLEDRAYIIKIILSNNGNQRLF